MSNRTPFAVVNKRGKVIEHTSRISDAFNRVFYKGKMYALRSPLPGMKAKRIIVLGTEYSVVHKKEVQREIKKSDRKVAPVKSKVSVKPKIKEQKESLREFLVLDEEEANEVEDWIGTQVDNIQTQSDVEKALKSIREKLKSGSVYDSEDGIYYNIEAELVSYAEYLKK